MAVTAMPQTREHRHTKRAVALLLTFAAGFVDIVGFLTIYQTFTAHMTGTTVHLSADLLQRQWSGVFAAASVLIAFVSGSIIGRSIIEVGWRSKIRRIASAALLIEAGLIAAVGVVGRSGSRDEGTTLVFLALLAAAMGVQTATLTRIGALTVHTTFVTGMLNKLAQLLSQGVFLSWDIHRGRDVQAERQKVMREARFIFSIWLVYFIGAVAGTSLQSFWHAQALLLPAGIAMVAMAVDQAAPLSIEEERDQP